MVLDPACGAGGFLTNAIENIRAQDVHSVQTPPINSLQKKITLGPSLLTA